ncbi:hypothetical protein ABFA07_023201 [Porites harrisoni]
MAASPTGQRDDLQLSLSENFSRYISSNVLPNFMQSLSNHGLSSLPEPSGLPSIWRRLHDWKYVLLHFLTS